MPRLDPAAHASPYRFFMAISRKNRAWFVASMLLYCAGSASLLLTTYFLGLAVDAVNAHSPSTAALVAWLIVFVFGFEICYRIGHICENRALTAFRSNIKKTLFDHTVSLSFGFFADRFAGELAHKVSAVADAFDRMLLIISNSLVEYGALLLVAALLLGQVHPYYAVFVTAWGALFVLGSYLFAGEANRRSAAFAEAEAETNGAVVDVYGNISSVKVYGAASGLKNAHRHIDAEVALLRRLGWWDVITANYQGTSIIILSCGIIAISAYLYGRSAITGGQIVFVSACALNLFNMAWESGRAVGNFIRARGEAVQNLNDLVVAPAIVDGAHAGMARKSGRGPIPVEYRGVTFGYGQGAPVLEGFSLVVRPGEKLGIVGLSGAGKTTFANLLLRFFDPQQGSIMVDGRGAKDLTQDFLRSHISYISQDTSLFHASIAENIAYGADAASEADIERAARLAYADDFIAALPKGYESIVGERGIKLSGGQRQRIAIARAILADRPLFLLDEATSALDSDSEAKIQKGLGALMERKTVIAIAHRLSTLSHMDRIVFLESGRIVEDGTHAELLALGGKYSKLWHMQAGGFLPDTL